MTIFNEIYVFHQFFYRPRSLVFTNRIAILALKAKLLEFVFFGKCLALSFFSEKSLAFPGFFHLSGLFVLSDLFLKFWLFYRVEDDCEIVKLWHTSLTFTHKRLIWKHCLSWITQFQGHKVSFLKKYTIAENHTFDVNVTAVKILISNISFKWMKK